MPFFFFFSTKLPNTEIPNYRMTTQNYRNSEYRKLGKKIPKYRIPKKFFFIPAHLWRKPYSRELLNHQVQSLTAVLCTRYILNLKVFRNTLEGWKRAWSWIHTAMEAVEKEQGTERGGY